MNPWDTDPPTYQHYAVMDALKDALRPLLKEGDMLIWRDAFRWKNDEGVLPNHYEMFDLPQLCMDFGYEIVHDFCHVAVVRSNAELRDAAPASWLAPRSNAELGEEGK